jgi:hypothetical protein
MLIGEGEGEQPSDVPVYRAPHQMLVMPVAYICKAVVTTVTGCMTCQLLPHRATVTSPLCA